MKYIKRYVIDIFDGEGNVQEVEDENGSWCKASDVKKMEDWYKTLLGSSIGRATGFEPVGRGFDPRPSIHQQGEESE